MAALILARELRPGERFDAAASALIGVFAIGLAVLFRADLGAAPAYRDFGPTAWHALLAVGAAAALAVAAAARRYPDRGALWWLAAALAIPFVANRFLPLDGGRHIGCSRTSSAWCSSIVLPLALLAVEARLSERRKTFGFAIAAVIADRLRQVWATKDLVSLALVFLGGSVLLGAAILLTRFLAARRPGAGQRRRLLMRRIILICVGFALLATLDLGIPLSVLAGRAAILRERHRGQAGARRRAIRATCFAASTASSPMRSAISPTFRRPRRSARAARPCAPECMTENGQPVFVVLAPADNGTWRAEQASQTEPAPGTLFIRGKVRYGGFLTGRRRGKCPSGRCFSGRVDYGIETWFGPQGVPAQVDRAARNQVTAVVRIDRHGNAVLADLLINGVAGRPLTLARLTPRPRSSSGRRRSPTAGPPRRRPPRPCARRARR